MWKKSRNGVLNLNRSINRRCWRYATKMLNGARRPNYLALACRALNKVLRIHGRLAKAEPHLFGPHSHQYYLDTLEMEREQKQREAALRCIYGPPKPGEPEFVSTLWTDRYYPPDDPEGRRIFFKWFHEKYPPL
jgi:hypothetical protein